MGEAATFPEGDPSSMSAGRWKFPFPRFGAWTAQARRNRCMLLRDCTRVRAFHPTVSAWRLRWLPVQCKRIWVRDLERDTMSRLTRLQGRNNKQLWTPDGRSIVFAWGYQAFFRSALTVPGGATSDRQQNFAESAFLLARRKTASVPSDERRRPLGDLESADRRRPRPSASRETRGVPAYVIFRGGADFFTGRPLAGVLLE